MRRQTGFVFVFALALVLTFSIFVSAETKDLALASNGATVKVDSSYSGYSPSRLIDGELNDKSEEGRWEQVAWASAETASEHWIEITLAETSEVTGVSVWWARDRGIWWMSSNFVIQYMANDAWVDLWEYTSSLSTTTVYSTEITFSPVKTDKIRVLQRAGGGPVARKNLMWVAEVQVWGSN